jgi:hypothetical protein
MRPVSDKFKAAVTQTHDIATLVEVLQDSVVIGTLNTVTAGTVTLDAKAQSRGRLDLTVIDDGTLHLVPTTSGDMLAPYGRELRVSRGVRYPDLTTELVSLGVFRIDDTNIEDTDSGLQIQVSGMDRSARVSDARFEAPYQIAAGTNLATAILALIQPVLPDLVTSFVATAVTTPAVFAEEEGDRWELAQKLASDAGLRLYFDGDGTLVLDVDSSGAPVVTIAEGPGGVLLSAARRWTSQGAFNRVIATGESTGIGTPVRGVATDTNPLSPTYYFGPFGPRPRFYRSQFIVTAQQALDAATAMLSKELGTTQTVSFGSLVLPHLEPGDVARVTRSRAGINEDNILDSLVIPLTYDGSMTGATRASQVFA